jgi:hypothetical protein
MKMLHILKSEPDTDTETLMAILSEAADATTFKLYEGEPDYETLIDEVFAHDKVISWW